MTRIAILGSTGSIGRSTLKIVETYPERFSVVSLAAGNNLGLAFEDEERALLRDLQAPQGLLLGIKVHIEDGEILELGPFRKPGDNRLLQLTLPTPRGGDMDQNRFSCFKSSLKGLRIIG